MLIVVVLIAIISESERNKLIIIITIFVTNWQALQRPTYSTM